MTRMSSAILSLLIAFFTTIDVGSPISDTNGRILGGTPVAVGEYPYVVAIYIDTKFRCSGFIYSERWVVTSASCLRGISPASVTVEAGIVSLYNPEPSLQAVDVVSIQPYSSFSYVTGLHDIALLQTVSPFTFNENVAFIYYDEFTNNFKANFTGWGATQSGGPPSKELLTASVTYTFPEDCSAIYGDIFNKFYMICFGATALGDTQSPCRYDEGSPLVQDNLAIGIMARNNGCGANGMATFDTTIYTRLSAYYSWLISTAGLQPFTNI